MWIGLVTVLSLIIAVHGEPVHVHIIPHSHCDPGWLHTVDEYFNLQVNDIINSVVDDLSENPTHKFVWSEVSYFQMWWDAASEAKRSKLKSVVNSKQLEFIMGGWVMSDEACPTLEATLNNFQTGHDFLESTVGVVPRWGWQIDPFGASSISPLVYALLGYDGAVFDRVDQRLVNYYGIPSMANSSGALLDDKALQFYWQPSTSYPNVSLFSHIMEGGYCSPTGWTNKKLSNTTVFGLDFDGDPLQNQQPNAQVNNENIEYIARQFINTCLYRSQHVRTPHLLMPFGCDFRWRNATINYSNMDKLLSYLRDDPSGIVQGKLTFEYSTLSEYMDAVINYPNTEFPVKKAGSDFLPYDTCWAEPNMKYYNSCIGYWSGYYSSRPIIKLESRVSEDRLRSLEQLALISQSVKALPPLVLNEVNAALTAARRTVGLVQHHDAITGTMRQHVLDDYMSKLRSSRHAAESSISAMLKQLLAIGATDGIDLGAVHGIDAAQRGPLCDECVMPVVIYNSLGWTRKRIVAFPCFDLDESVLGADGSAVDAQIVPRQYETGAPYTIYFRAVVPPLGVQTYFISRNRALGPKHVSNVDSANGTSADLSNGMLHLTFARSPAGAIFLDSVRGPQLPLTPFPLKQSFNFYESQGDGAYTLRPTSDTAAPVVPTTPNATIFSGPLVSELTQSLTDLITHSVRVYSGDTETEASVIEVTMTNLGVTEIEELVTRFATDGAISTNGSFLTGNGIEMIPRSYVERPGDMYSWNTRAGNFYPMLPSAYIQDEKVRLTVHGRQVMAVSQTSAGSIEVMLHRRSITDDGRGLLEPLDDESRINVTLWITVTTPDAGEWMHKRQSFELNHPLMLFAGGGAFGVRKSSWEAAVKPFLSFLKADLPEDLHLLSLSPRDSDITRGILRLQNTRAAGSSGAKSEQIDIESIFQGVTVASPRAAKLSLLHDGEVETGAAEVQTLAPLEIRTFSFSTVPSTKPGAGDYLVYALSAGAVVVVVALGAAYFVRRKSLASSSPRKSPSAPADDEVDEAEPLLHP